MARPLKVEYPGVVFDITGKGNGSKTIPPKGSGRTLGDTVHGDPSNIEGVWKKSRKVKKRHRDPILFAVTPRVITGWLP
jgi:hypothetical protein